MTRIECLREQDAFGRLEAAWSALHRDSPTATVFNSPHYTRLWWRHFGSAGTLQIWVVWEGARPIGIAPLHVTGDAAGRPVRRLLGGVDVSDYLDVLVAPGQAARVVGALLDGWADVPGRCPIELRGMKAASPVREAFLRLAAERSLSLDTAPEEHCPVLTLPTHWSHYLEGLAGRQRREIRRKMRRAGDEAIVSWHVARAPLSDGDLDHFFALHAASSPDKAHFMSPAMRAFFTDLIQLLVGRGEAELTFLLVDGRYAATFLTLLHRDEMQLYNSGFDPALGVRLSPGWILLGYLIEDAIARGFQRFDFLRGEEPYKYQFGARSETIHQIRIEGLGRRAGAAARTAPSLSAGQRACSIPC